MKKCISAALAAVIVLIVISGCGNDQQTSQTEASVNTEQDIAFVQPVTDDNLRLALGVPESIQQTKTLGDTSIEFDAAIEMPDVSAVPVIEISLHNVSDEDIAAFNNAVFSNKAYFQSGNGGNQNWDRLFFRTEEEYESTSGIIEPFSESCAMRRKNGDVYGYIEYHRNHDPKSEPFMFSSVKVDSPLMENGWAPNISLSPNDALVQAKQVIAPFASDFDCVCCAANHTYRLDVPEHGNVYGYSFHFTRSYAGIPTVYTLWECAEIDEYSDFRCQSYEGVHVVVSEYGIEYVWYAPRYDIIGTLEENAELLYFEDIMNIALAMLEIKHSDNIHIDRITFGYTRVQMRDAPERYIMIPVWDFFGMSDTANETEPYQYDSLLTVNAMDGTIVNRSWGQ